MVEQEHRNLSNKLYLLGNMSAFICRHSRWLVQFTYRKKKRRTKKPHYSKSVKMNFSLYICVSYKFYWLSHIQYLIRSFSHIDVDLPYPEMTHQSCASSRLWGTSLVPVSKHHFDTVFALALLQFLKTQSRMVILWFLITAFSYVFGCII